MLERAGIRPDPPAGRIGGGTGSTPEIIPGRLCRIITQIAQPFTVRIGKIGGQPQGKRLGNLFDW